jgi:hypothetical protein
MTATPTNIRQRLLAWCPLGWVRRILRDGAPYLDRYSLRAQGPSGHNPWRIYLHRFHAPDGPDLHNHPSAWSFSIVLWGSYTEDTLAGRRRVRWFNWVPAQKYHRIVSLYPGPGARSVWTIFICGPLTGRGWGFLRNGRHVAVEVVDGK